MKLDPLAISWRGWCAIALVPPFSAALIDIRGCPADLDQDGWTVQRGDCDDNNPDVHPGASEICNFRDDDCDRQVDEGVGVVEIAAGASYSMALCPDGIVWTWGDNSFGQLGDGTDNSRSTPGPVLFLDHVVSIAAGYLHGLALRADGTVWAWGANYGGQLGNGVESSPLPNPVPVVGLTGVQGVAAGRDFSFALLEDGTLRSWGYNASGVLGDGNATSSAVPVQVLGIGQIQGIDGGGYHAVAYNAEGLVLTWGLNDFFQLGYGQVGVSSSLAQVVPGIARVVGVTAGDLDTFVVLSDGSVKGWGSNFVGQLGNGTVSDYSIPLNVLGLDSATAVTAGYGHAVALLADGTLRAWGDNQLGELGNDTTDSSPLAVPVLNLNDVSAIAAGMQFTLALRTDGTVYAWGDNASGQLGRSGAPYSTLPGQVLVAP